MEKERGHIRVYVHIELAGIEVCMQWEFLKDLAKELHHLSLSLLSLLAGTLASLFLSFSVPPSFSFSSFSYSRLSTSINLLFFSFNWAFQWLNVSQSVNRSIDRSSLQAEAAEVWRGQRPEDNQTSHRRAFSSSLFLSLSISCFFRFFFFFLSFFLSSFLTFLSPFLSFPILSLPFFVYKRRKAAAELPLLSWMNFLLYYFFSFLLSPFSFICCV